MKINLCFLFSLCSILSSFAQSDCFTDCAARAQTQWEQLKARGETSTDSALLINKEILENLKGCPFPKTKLSNLYGEPLTIDDLKGNVVFVHFWFTSCATCIAEMPSIKQLQTLYAGQPVKFLAVSFNEEEKLLSFFKKYGKDGAIQARLDQKNMESDFCILDGYPLNLVLNKNGQVIDAWYEENPESAKQNAFYEKTKELIQKAL